MIKIAVFLIIAAAMIVYAEDEQMPFKDQTRSVEERVDDLVSRMTIDEKVSMLRSTKGVASRLGVPRYNWWAECLHGVTRPRDGKPSTCYPQAMGMASSWNPVLLKEITDAMGDEARARHHHLIDEEGRTANGLTFFSPNINILRDPRWGRGLETYGEDPYLTARMGVAFVQGLQGDDPKYLKAAATAKHYVAHSGPERIRRSFDAKVSKKDLFETYLPAFEALVKEGDAAIVMSAYNAVNGIPCTANDYLLNKVLRDSWGFDGPVISDDQSASDVCGYHKMTPTQKEGGAMCINNGCDIELGHAAFKHLAEAVKDGLVTDARLDEAVTRAMTVRFRLGMFDPPETVPFSKIPKSVIGCDKYRDLARQMARESMVLLKNKGSLLPLNAEKIKKVAVIGPNADCETSMTANYWWSIPSAMITPLQGIKERLGDNVEVVYCKGTDRLSSQGMEPVPSASLLPKTDQENRQGLEASYYNNREFKGEPVLKRIDQEISFDWKKGSPHESIGNDNFSVVWEGRLIASETGIHRLSTESDDGVRVWLDGKKVIDRLVDGVSKSTSDAISLEKGRKYPIRIEYFENAGSAAMELKWVMPAKDTAGIIAAEKLASESDVAIVMVGLNAHGDEVMEGEWGDRRGGIVLSSPQEKLLKKVHATGTPTVLVLLNGGPVTSVWAEENVPAILEAWYPGQEGGTAVAEVLFGDYNPAGRLPCTVYRSEEQIPEFTNYSMEGRTYRFFKGDPLYEFGFGLSYTEFEYSDLKTEVTDDGVKVSVKIANTGKVDGDEVVQLYVKDLASSVRVPNKSLAGFKRKHLKAGETVSVEFAVTRRQLSVVNEDGVTMFEPGEFEIMVGASSKDARLRRVVEINK